MLGDSGNQFGPGRQVERQVSKRKFAQAFWKRPIHEIVPDAAKLRMPLQLVERMAQERRSKIGPNDEREDELVIGGQRGGRDIGAARLDEHRAIEAIALEDWIEQVRRVLAREVLMAV